LPEAEAPRYFDLPRGRTFHSAPLMLLVAPLRPGRGEEVPAVRHVDGTGRLPSVGPDGDPAFHRLLKRFGSATGTPVLLNTSFNLKGEPIVNSPSQALRTFGAGGLDAAYLGPFEATRP